MYLVVLNKIFVLKDNLHEFLLQARRLILKKEYLRDYLQKYNEILCVMTENKRLALSRVARQEGNFEFRLEEPPLQLVFFNEVESKYSRPTEFLSFSLYDNIDKIEILYESNAGLEVSQVGSSVASKIDLRVSASSFEEETRKRFYMLRDELFG